MDNAVLEAFEKEVESLQREMNGRLERLKAAIAQEKAQGLPKRGGTAEKTPQPLKQSVL